MAAYRQGFREVARSTFRKFASWTEVKGIGYTHKMRPSLPSLLLLIPALIVSLLMTWSVSREISWFRIFGVVHGEGKQIYLPTELQITEAVLQSSGRHDIDPMLILAVIKVESRFRPKARSHRGALGLMQVKPIALREVRPKEDYEESDYKSLIRNIPFNIDVGTHYLSWLLKQYDNNKEEALTAYNFGPTAMNRRYKKQPLSRGRYAARVLRAYKEFSSP